MILSDNTLRRRMGIITPFIPAKTIDPDSGMSYGLSSAGYDIRIAQDILIWPYGHALASSVERFRMPDDVVGLVADKSSWARRFVAVQNTVIEPGWRGHLTLELTNHRCRWVRIRAGMPIAQVLFLRMDAPAVTPYAGKYQDQPDRPVSAIRESV